MTSTTEQPKIKSNPVIDTLGDVFCQTWCRIAFGHLMVDLGTNCKGQRLWMCERCHRVEALNKVA